jgi:hypothetical protein
MDPSLAKNKTKMEMPWHVRTGQQFPSIISPFNGAENITKNALTHFSKCFFMRKLYGGG